MLKLFIQLALICYTSLLFAVTSNINIVADEFELDGEKKQIKATGHVQVTQDDILLKSGWAFYDQNKEVIELFDNVNISRDKLNLNCDKAVAFGSENRINAKGNVNFIYEKISGTASEARYNLDEKQVILLGNPKVNHDGDYIIGAIIIVDLERQKVITKGNAEVKITTEKFK